MHPVAECSLAQVPRCVVARLQSEYRRNDDCKAIASLQRAIERQRVRQQGVLLPEKRVGVHFDLSSIFKWLPSCRNCEIRLRDKTVGTRISYAANGLAGAIQGSSCSEYTGYDIYRGRVKKFSINPWLLPDRLITPYATFQGSRRKDSSTPKDSFYTIELCT